LKINRIMPFCNLFLERPSYFNLYIVCCTAYSNHIFYHVAAYLSKWRQIPLKGVDVLLTGYADVIT